MNAKKSSFRKLEVEYLDGYIQELDQNQIHSLEPKKFNLLQNNPNPFNNETTIYVEILNNTEIVLLIYDVLGKKVKTLEKRNNKSPGFYMYKWNGKNDEEVNVSSGVYFALLNSKKQTKRIKIVLIK